MMENRVKRILREGGLALGGHIGSMGGIPMVEILGHAGFDAVFIDMEHTAYDLRDIQVMIVTAERIGITPIVRTPGFDPALILRILDMGAQGIQVPHIGGAAEARAAVQAVRYPPLGERGMMGSSRVADYGRLPILQLMEKSNREITLTVMVEDLKALEEIDAIASTPGVDIVAIGPSDMARALGTSGRPDDPKMAETVNRVAGIIKKSGNSRMAFPANHPAYPLSIAQLKALGVGYCNCPPAPESILLRAMTQQVADLRRQME